MNIVPSRLSILDRFFLTQRGAQSVPSVDMTKMGCLYILAAIFQAGWLYLVASNYSFAAEWVKLPLIGWALAAIWILMTWCVPHLLVLGVKMIQMSRNPSFIITQTDFQKGRQKTVALLLIIGITLDLFVLPVMFGFEDKSSMLFISGLMGGRVAQANLEAILQYHNM